MRFVVVGLCMAVIVSLVTVVAAAQLLIQWLPLIVAALIVRRIWRARRTRPPARPAISPGQPTPVWTVPAAAPAPAPILHTTVLPVVVVRHIATGTPHEQVIVDAEVIDPAQLTPGRPPWLT